MIYQDDEQSSAYNNPGPDAGAGSFAVDPQQLAQLLMVVRAAQQMGQGASLAGQPSAPAPTASVLGPTDPFAAGGTPGAQPSAQPPQPNPALVALLKSVRDPKPLQSLGSLMQGGGVPVTVPLGVSSEGSLIRDVLVNAPSQIPRPGAGREVKPNLRVSDPVQLQRTLGGLMRGIGGPESAPLGVLPDGSLVRDMSYLAKAPGLVTGPEVKPDLIVSAPNQLQRTLGGLMRGIAGPENPPLGVLPDGSLVRDVSYLAKAPSRIFPQRDDGFIFGDKVTPEFLTKVKQISSNLGIDPNWLMAVMEFESGLSPSTRNTKSGAVGLIQFTKASGYDQKKLAGMTAENQLDYVADYLKKHKGKLGDLSDLYMSVLWPAAIGKPDDYVLFKSPSKEYKQNSGLDVAGKGFVTKADAAAAVESRYREGLKQGTTILNVDGSSESRLGNKTIVQLPRRPSIIPRSAAAPEVKPNLTVSDPRQSRTTLDKLMR